MVARRTDTYSQDRNNCANRMNSIPIGNGRIEDVAVGSAFLLEWHNGAYPTWEISALPSADRRVVCQSRSPAVFVGQPEAAEPMADFDSHPHHGLMAVDLPVEVEAELHDQAADAGRHVVVPADD